MDELDAVARTEVQPGWHVYDVDGQLIGSVDRVNDSSFSVRPAGPGGTTVDVGFDDIESADDGRVTLALNSDELATVADEAAIP
jgi:hypothetical protein